MKTLYATLGLPGSGKTTWCREQFLKNPTNSRIICKDNIREMLAGGKYWNGTFEKHTLKVRNNLMDMFAKLGVDIYVADTNLSPKHQEFFKNWCRENGYKLVFKDFRDVPLQICIANDLKRVDSVGEFVIRSLHDKYIRPIRIKEFHEYCRKCGVEPGFQGNRIPTYIFDIDGTIADNSNRHPYDWDKVVEDKPIVPTINISRALHEYFTSFNNYEMVFLSGRDGVSYDDTFNWIKKVIAPGYRFTLFMREPRCNRPDWEIKKEILVTKVLTKYNVLGVFDDRQQVVDMWRDCGYTCFQVAEGKF